MPPQNRAGSSDIPPPPPPVPPVENGIPQVNVAPSRGKKHKATLIITVFLLLIGTVSIGLVVQNQIRMRPGAWNCRAYNFNVTRQGVVTVTNNSNVAETPQQATVMINGGISGTFDVPRLAVGESANIGNVNVPPSGDFTWTVTGSVDCSDTGSYTTEPTPTIEVTPTVEPTVSPTPPTEPTITPTLPPEPTDSPEPTTTPKPTNTPMPTATGTPQATPTTRPPDPTPGPPNVCNGTCGSDANCNPGLICVAGRCRNGNCSDQISCACPPAWPTTAPSPTPAKQIAKQLEKTGDNTTWIVSFGGLLLLGLGALLAI
jgi:hypothetical protein